jgi:plasmid stabilization system protein ParE
MEILRTSSFWRDLQGIIDHFDDAHAEDAAFGFLDAVDATIDFIRQFPDLGSPWESANPRRGGLRFQLVKGFENYVLIYRRHNEQLFVLRVLHGSRNIEELLG